jgi:4-hydroxyphenylpyruvate dioxygenase
MDILDNPLELCGFAFIEFVSTENGLDQIFETIGFSKVAKHKSKKFIYGAKVISILF